MSGEAKRTVITRTQEDLSSREAVERFRQASTELMKKATRSKESAMKVLVEAGIYTKLASSLKIIAPNQRQPALRCAS